MNEQNNGKTPFWRSKWFFIGLAAICALLVLIPVIGSFAKYITTETTESEVKAQLFFMDGEYAEEIKDGKDGSEIEVSGWKDGIFLTFSNQEGEDISEVDIECTCEVSGGWTATPTTFTLKGKQSSEQEIELTPPTTTVASATQEQELSKIEFTLITAPYEKVWKATFVLTDSDKPDWTLEDKGAYTLLTVQTNDYAGDITVSYDNAIFAPDSTNALMASWVRANGEGTFTAKRFTTYQLMLFEEQPKVYTFTQSSGSGNTISVTVQQEGGE